MNLPGNLPLCREATTSDLDLLVSMVRQFCTHFEYRFSEPQTRRILGQLIEDRQLGHAFLVCDGESVVGYVLLGFSFSLEYGGRTAFIDEFFIVPAGRGRGLGKVVLKFVESVCREHGIAAISLEAEDTNPRAAAMYAQSGYEALGRHLMTRLLDPAAGYKAARQAVPNDEIRNESRGA